MWVFYYSSIMLIRLVYLANFQLFSSLYDSLQLFYFMLIITSLLWWIIFSCSFLVVFLKFILQMTWFLFFHNIINMSLSVDVLVERVLLDKWIRRNFLCENYYWSLSKNTLPSTPLDTIYIMTFRARPFQINVRKLTYKITTSSANFKM